MEKLKQGLLRAWLCSAYEGNEQAQENLHGYIRPRLLARIRSVFPSDPRTDDLASLTLYRIDTRLEAVMNRIRVGKRVVSNTFIDWCFSQLNQTIAETFPYRHLETASRRTIGDFIPDYQERAEQIILELPPTPRRVVRPLIFDDQTISEVAESLAMSESAVKQALHRARTKMELKLLIPFRISRVSAWKDPQVQYAVITGHLDSFKFLNLWYTDEQAIERYKESLAAPRRIVLPPQIDEEVLRSYHLGPLSPDSGTHRKLKPNINQKIQDLTIDTEGKRALQVCYLWAKKNYSFQQISETLGINKNSVRGYIDRVIFELESEWNQLISSVRTHN